MRKSSAVDASRCARCGGEFHCGVDDEGPCWCSRIRLSEGTLAELEKRYRGCLCAACLTTVQAPADITRTNS